MISTTDLETRKELARFHVEFLVCDKKLFFQEEEYNYTITVNCEHIFRGSNRSMSIMNNMSTTTGRHISGTHSSYDSKLDIPCAKF